MQATRDVVAGASLVQAALRSRLDNIFRNELLVLAGFALLGLGQGARLLLHLNLACSAGGVRVLAARPSHLLRHVGIIYLVLEVLGHGLLRLVHLLHVTRRVVVILAARCSAVGHVGALTTHIIQTTMVHVQEAGRVAVVKFGLLYRIRLTASALRYTHAAASTLMVDTHLLVVQVRASHR